MWLLTTEECYTFSNSQHQLQENKCNFAFTGPFETHIYCQKIAFQKKHLLSDTCVIVILSVGTFSLTIGAFERDIFTVGQIRDNLEGLFFSAGLGTSCPGRWRSGDTFPDGSPCESDQDKRQKTHK